MSKNIIYAIFILIFTFSCSKYIPQNEQLNYHLTSQLGYEFLKKEGLNKIIEKHIVTEDSLAFELINLLSVKFEPEIEYTHEYDKEGKILQTYLNNNKEYAINYEYGPKKELFSIAGYKPKYVKEIFEYHPDGYIKYIYRETEDNIMYKYSKDYKTVSCMKFRPIKDGNKRGLKADKLLYQMLLKNYEDGSFVIEVIDADKAIQIEKYTYMALKLLKKELNEGRTVIYEYDKYDNNNGIKVELENGKTINYSFEYSYDSHDNWVNRIIIRDSIQILKTERNISYYN